MVDVTHKQLSLPDLGNEAIARQLDEIAERLTQQGDSPFRCAAYRNVAASLRKMDRPVRDVVDDEGLAGLLRLPGIGPTIGRAIEQFIKTGTMPRLEQLRELSAPQRLFTTVAEIGPKLAAEIHSALGINTLAELEAAAWDGRLAKVAGIGSKRIRAVREALAGRFRRPSITEPPRQHAPPIDQPCVELLLEIDEEYRRRAQFDRLPRVAPKRLNPEGKAWLPIFHTRRDGHTYTALFSNTARAHELGTTHDWVVIYRDDEADHGQWTVITSQLGKLKGKRVVRGREQECAAYYSALLIEP